MTTLLRRLAFALIIASASGPAPGASLICDRIDIRVENADPALATRICETASRALPRLAACNVPVPLPVTVRITDALEDDCMGLYHCAEGVIELTPPALMPGRRSDDSPFSHVPDAEFFDSVLVHELAHVAFDAVPCPFDSCQATAEYVAYVMQVGSLSPGQIAGFEAAVGRDGETVSRASLSAVLHAMAPYLFAGLAWTHFNQRPEPCGYIGLLMAGDLLLDRERP